MDSAIQLLSRKENSPSALRDAHLERSNHLTLAVDQWANQIRSAWAKGATNTLELARVVCRARLAMRYGAWAQMWSSTQMPFSKRKADKRVSIGRHLGGLDENNCAHLPSGWSILYCLSHLDLIVLEKLVQEGAIYPRLTLQEAKILVASLKGHSAGAQSRKANVQRRLRNFEVFVQSTLADWSCEECQMVRESLRDLIDRIQGHGGTEFQGVLNAAPELGARSFSIFPQR